MITIYGASDDLVEVDGCEGADEFYVANVDDGKVCWHGDLVAPGGTEQLRARAIYDDGVWSIALGQTDDGVPFPAWRNDTEQAPRTDYSAAVVIDAPAGTRLTNVWPEPQRQS